MITRMLLITGVAAGIWALPASAQQMPVSPYAIECPAGVQKLQTGIEVIGVTEGQLAAARRSLASAQQLSQAGAYYLCTESVKSGLKALDAG